MAVVPIHIAPWEMNPDNSAVYENAVKILLRKGVERKDAEAYANQLATVQGINHVSVAMFITVQGAMNLTVNNASIASLTGRSENIKSFINHSDVENELRTLITDSERSKFKNKKDEPLTLLRLKVNAVRYMDLAVSLERLQNKPVPVAQVKSEKDRGFDEYLREEEGESEEEIPERLQRISELLEEDAELASTDDDDEYLP